MLTDNSFIEVDYHRHSKNGQSVAGDVFVSHRVSGTDRTICVLADGLGSGIKANVLATLTATMAMKYVSSDIDLFRASEIIMKTLPICKVRNIGYSTFSIFDIKHDGMVDVVEFDNPPFVLIRDHKKIEVDKQSFKVTPGNLGPRDVWHSRFRVKRGDRAIILSDGITQSGIGTPTMPLGWTDDAAAVYTIDLCKRRQDISARSLARQITARALQNDGYRARDDMTCAVIYVRKPRRTMIITGPPIDKKKDCELANLIETFDGRRIICGGTTANIVARELDKTLNVDLSMMAGDIPPISRMSGVDLVTEGILTLTRCVDILENSPNPDVLDPNAAVQIVRILLDSDIIEFVVGTKINDAHQDPNLPVELDIRKNLLKKFVGLLNRKYLKQASMTYI